MGLTEKVLWPIADRLSEHNVIVFSSQVRKRMDGGILQAREMPKFSLKKKNTVRSSFAGLLQVFGISFVRHLYSARTLASAVACDEVIESAKGAVVWGFYISWRTVCMSTFLSGNHKLPRKGSIKLVGPSITEVSLTFRGSGLVDGCLHSFA